MFKRFAVLLAVALVAGCAGFPQSRDSFLQESGGEGGRTQELVVDRPFSSVFRSLQWGVKECLNGQVEHQIKVDDESRRVFNRYRTALVSKWDGYAELTTQMAQEPVVLDGEMPAGGFYVAAANLKVLSSSRTKATLFSAPIGEGPAIAAAMEAWVRGGAAACPAL